ATFEETADADLLLHIVDASDRAKHQHIETTENLLAELKLDRIACLLVFNKIDLISPPEAEALRRQHPDACFVSATDQETTRELLDRIAERWDQGRQPFRDAEEVHWIDASAPPSDEVALEEEAHSMTTLDELLGKRRRSRRRTGAPV